MEVFTDVGTFVEKHFYKRLKAVFATKPEILAVLENDSRRIRTLEKIKSEIRKVELKGIMLSTESMKTLICDITDMYAYNLLRVKRKEFEGVCEVDEKTLDYMDAFKEAEDRIGFSNKAKRKAFTG